MVPSPRGNRLLILAIRDNLIGQKERAFNEAVEAQRIYSKVGNIAGALRSQLESVYSLRRQLKGRECQDRFFSLAPLFQNRNYVWLKTRIAIEASGCIAMMNDFDRAWHMANEAADKAQRAHYPALQLRALGYLGSFHTIEGRLSESWETNQAGLKTFWNGAFPRDRAYQFYADLEFAAEKAEQWHVAAALQREAIEQFRESRRLDFKAAAHCRLARMEEMTGDVQKMQGELEVSRQLFQELGKDAKVDLNETDCEVAWGSIEARYGSVDSALQHLARVQPDVEHTDGFTIRLRYEKAWADLERRRGNWGEEQEHLEKAISIGNKGFLTLQSPRDRWDWRHEVGDAYRQLLQLEIQHSHDAKELFANWELFRSIQTPSPVLPNRQLTGNPYVQALVSSRLKDVRRGTIVAFAVFPRWVTAWVANDQGVHEFRILADSEVLKKDVRAFYQLCSNPLTPLEKVNDAGSRLYKLLVAPVEQALDPTRTLFIEADQFLGLLPWPALVRTDGIYLGHIYNIVNTPGLLYRESRAIRRDAMAQVLVAYPGAVELNNSLYQPLPQAKEAAEFVAGLALHHKYLQGTDVSARNLLAELPKASSFLFSGHATTRAYSGELVIHGHNGGGVFSASRLAGMDLSGMKLVVLSACSTAGEPEAANDPNGLVKAFLNAGTESVIASQWDVSSGSTADLVRDLFMGLSKNPSGKLALREIWKNAATRSSHPFYWAAFQAYGPAE